MGKRAKNNRERIGGSRGGASPSDSGLTCRIALLIGSLLCLLPAACNDRPPIDDSGVFPEPAGHRIVALAPAAAEMLQVLDRLDEVVGIGEFGPWPAGIEALP